MICLIEMMCLCVKVMCVILWLADDTDDVFVSESNVCNFVVR